MKNVNEPTDQLATSMFAAIERRERVLAKGLNELEALKATIQRAVDSLGIRVEYDPSSSASFVDYFGIAALSGASGAVAGAGLGALCGALFDDVGLGMGLGAVVGGIVGVASGLDAIDRGWRLSVNYYGGLPVALLEPKE